MAISIKVTVEVEQQGYEAGVKDIAVLKETARSAMTGEFSMFPATMINRAINATAQNACVSAIQKVNVMRGVDEK